MKFSLTLLALPVVALASPFVVERAAAVDNAALILKDLQQLVKDVNAENTTLNGFADSAKPSTAQIIALNNGANAIGNDLNKTTTDAKASSVTTSAESTKTYNYLSKTVYPATAALLQNFVDHYPGLKAAGLQPIIENSLKTQKSQSDALSAALIAIASGPSKSKGPALTKKFDAAFNAAIAKYAS